eukprot:5894542-Pyramimonas_sp.AAC.1
MTLDLGQVLPQKWAFITLWTLAAEVLRAGAKSLRLGTFDYLNVDGHESSIIPLLEPGNPSWAVWPDEFRPPRRPRRENEIPDDLLDQRPRKPKRRTAGVQVGRERGKGSTRQ